MEKRIKSYESYIKTASKNPSESLWQYHRAMVQDFQHERIIHLFVMFFFIALTLGTIIFDCILVSTISTDIEFANSITNFDPTNGFWVLWPLHILAVLLVILCAAYIKHYHFLENHIQKLYDYNASLQKIKTSNSPKKAE